MAMYLLKASRRRARYGNDPFSRMQRGFVNGFERMRKRYRIALHFCLDHAWMFVLLFMLLCGFDADCLVLGQDFFPSVDAGLIRLHVRGRVGERIEETARECDRVEQPDSHGNSSDDLGAVLDNIGLPYSSLNMSYSNSGTIGTSDAEILISLKPDHKQPTSQYISELRGKLAEQFPDAVFLSARRHREPDFELWSSGAD